MRDTVAVTRSLRPTASKRLKDTYKGKGLLLPRLERHVMRSMGDAPRPDDHSLQHMHPSDMAKKEWCGRHDYYRIIGTPIGAQELPGQPQLPHAQRVRRGPRHPGQVPAVAVGARHPRR